MPLRKAPFSEAFREIWPEQAIQVGINSQLFGAFSRARTSPTD
jgi:hypothetical protein